MKKFIFFITIFFIAITKTHANQAILLQEPISGIMVHYHTNNYSTVGYTPAEKLSFNGNTAYCLEMGKTIESSYYTYTTSFDELNLKEEDLEYIMLVAYYGYDYPGHKTNYYYMAAQELIWNRICKDYTSWSLDNVTSEVISYKEEKNNIKSLIEEHTKKPSFDNTEIEYILGDTMIIEDSNKILNNYVVETKNVHIEDNKLVIEKDFKGKEIVLSKTSRGTKEYFLYTSGISQKMMGVGTPDKIISKVKIKSIGGSIEIKKLDKETKLSVPRGEASLKGAIYNVYNEDKIKIDTLETGKKTKIDMLPLGKYYIQEITPSEGYQLDETLYTVEITKENLNVKQNVYEEIIKRKVEIFKVFATNTTGELLGEENITFEIYDKDNNKVDSITTDDKGYAHITLLYGTYKFKQVNTTKNYHKVEDFYVKIDSSDTRPIHKLLADSQITAKVKIIKKDLDTKENITNSNIKFKIYDVDNKKYISLKVSYPENKVTEEFQVDKNGIFITPIALPPGTYLLEEIPENMNGYLYNSDKIKFTIDSNSNFVKEDDEIYLEVPFYNKTVKGHISITKYGEEVKIIDNTFYYKKIPLEGVKINLYAKEDIYENSKIIYKKDELISTLISDKDGKIKVNNLPLGKYYLKEIETVSNHLIEEKEYNIDLLYIDEYTDNIKETIEINNYLPKGTLIINKHEKNTSNPIQGTLIELHNKEKQIIYKGYTDKNGIIKIEELPYGEYYLSEVESSTGYRLLEENIKVKIDKDIEEITIYNERIKIPNTGLSLNNTDILIIISIFLSIILIIIFHKEKVIVILSLLLIVLSSVYFTIKTHNYYTDYKNNKESIKSYINKEIKTETEEKYTYNSILEIPSINIKRGILDINNPYNDAKYNIELIKEDEKTIVLAAHNGKNSNSYFGNLKNININDEIKYYKDGIISTYKYIKSYDIKKNGYADLYTLDGQKSIVLITCKDNDENAQTIYIGYLKETSTY